MPPSIDHKTPHRRPGSRGAGRTRLLAGLLLLGLTVVAVRLAWLQIVEGSIYAERARRQYESKVTLQADRGTIYDRNGNLLATNAVSYSFAVDPTHVEHPEKLAKLFAEALGGERSEWLEKITRPNRSFVWLGRKIAGAPLARLKDIEDDGLIKIKEPLRRFEYAALGSQAIGCTDIDNNGLSGVELFYDERLKGADGFMVMQRDARGRRHPDADLPRQKPEHGDGLMLTLDVNIQGIVEEELRKGVESAVAASGTAIALDPLTGEILAIATYPSYDPNNMREADQATIRVRAITDTYEPGSTMKVVTAAAALEEGVIAPDDSIDGEGGELRLENHLIRDDHPAGMMNFREAIEQSSNIAFAKLATEIPTPRFYKYVRDFGFGIISGVDLPGEARGEVKKPNEFSEGTKEFMAFGYQLAVTPLQLVCAYAAVANGGVMMKPHLLRRRIGKDGTGEVLEEIRPQEIRQVISRETADTLRNLLVDVVEKGTGGAARVPGLKIAGKTGTSQQLSGGTYSKEKYNASFVGFFPADDPRVVLLVLLDSPTNGYYGGQVAAPIFREIALRISGAAVGPSEVPSRIAARDTASVHYVGSSRVRVPDLRGAGADGAAGICRKLGFRPLVQGEGRMVVRQEPEPGAGVDPRSVVTLYTGTPAEPGTMPDLRGMSVRRALNVLNSCRVRPRVSGGGIVRSQSPAPGTPIRSGREVSLVCGG